MMALFCVRYYNGGWLARRMLPADTCGQVPYRDS